MAKYLCLRAWKRLISTQESPHARAKQPLVTLNLRTICEDIENAVYKEKAAAAFVRNYKLLTKFCRLRIIIGDTSLETHYVACRVLGELSKGKDITLVAPGNMTASLLDIAELRKIHILAYRFWTPRSISVIDPDTEKLGEDLTQSLLHAKPIQDTWPLWKRYSCILNERLQRSFVKSKVELSFKESIWTYNFSRALDLANDMICRILWYNETVVEEMNVARIRESDGMTKLRQAAKAYRKARRSNEVSAAVLWEEAYSDWEEASRVLDREVQWHKFLVDDGLDAYQWRLASLIDYVHWHKGLRVTT